jgi:phosphatidylethanolamine/phosphatidyl-N-methylethanolamine N-methyltransferase
MSNRLNNFRYFFLSRIYDLALHWFYRPLVRRLVAAVNEQPGQRVLEIGVGTGISLPFYDAQRKHVTAIDCSLPMLATARRRAARSPQLHLTLQHAAAEDYPSQPGEFDQIVFCNCLSVMKQPAQVLEAYYNLLPTGGRIYLLNHFTPERGLLRQFDRMLAPVGAVLGFKNFFPLPSLLNADTMHCTSTLRTGYWRIVEISKADNHA